MISARRGMVSYLIWPLYVILVVGGFFCIVWLRSNLLSMEYKISELENRKMQNLRETKTLMADTAALRSLQKVENQNMPNAGLVFPDRTRVICIRGRRDVPQNVSLEGKQAVSPELKDY